MKILLIAGHGAGDPGACGNGYRETDLTREVVNLLADKLKEFADVDVDIYNQNRNAYYDVNKGNLVVNFANYDYVFEVHFNAGGGAGTEIYVTREESGTIVEEKIMQNLARFFNVRGVKRKNFNVIAKAKRCGVSSALLETCFIDNSNDVNVYQENKESIVQVIADGIKDGFGLAEGKYTTNVNNNQNNGIERINEDMKIWKNGSTKEPVYQYSNMSKEIGSLAPYEQCQAVKINDTCFIVYYKVDGTDYEKCGFVSYNGGI